MLSRRTTWWSLAGVALLAGVAAVAVIERTPVPPLPALKNYPRLPAVFAQRLRAARDGVAAHPRDPQELRHLARLYQANRLNDEARACYAAIAARPPGLSAQDHYHLADLAESAGDLGAAQRELRATVAADSRYLPARLALAETLFKSGDEEAAAKAYAAVLALEADQPQASLGLARLELQRGEENLAVPRLERLLARHPDATPAAALLAQILGRRGETERAAALTQWSRRRHEPVPPDPWRRGLLADCYDSQRLELKFEELLFSGQLDEALPLLARVQEIEPESWIPPMLRGWSQAQTHHQAEAVREYRRALAKGGDPEKICPLLVSSLLALNRVGDAATLLAEYHAKLPDSLPILIAYADVAVRQGDEPLARSLLVRVLKKEPYLYAPNMSLAKILWTRGERDEAVKCLQRIVRVFPVDVASRGLLGQYYLDKSDPGAAIPPLEQALPQAAAGSPARERLAHLLDVAYLTAGNAAAAAGRFTDAAGYFEKAIRLRPGEADGYAGQANACVQLKQFRRAADALEKLERLQPDNPTIFLSRGDVLHQAGQAEAARQEWRAARRLAPAADAELRAAIDRRLSGPVSADTFP